MMASRPSPSPPKPWERSNPSTASTTSLPSIPSPAIPTSSPATSLTSGVTAPILPERPATMGSAGSVGAYGQQAGAYGSRYGSTASGYGANTSPYGSSYSRLGQSSYGGGYGSSYGGGYGSMGGMSSYGGMGGYGGMSSYGGMGGMSGYGGMNSYGGMGGMGGMGGYGQNGMGMGGMGPDGISLSQRMEAGTMATFQVIQSIVGAFGGFAQMLESTFMATHSSFFAMIGVAEQFGHLRNYLGQVLSIFALIRWCRNLVDKVLGRESKEGAQGAITADGFRAFESGASVGINGVAANSKPRLAKKPLVIFLLTVIGLPWLMTRLVRIITARQEEEARMNALNPQYQQMGPLQLDQFGRPLPNQPQQAPIDPSSLTFVRGTFPYEATNPEELSIAVDEIIAVLTPTAERTSAPTWLKGRLRNGQVGYFPSTHVSDIPVKGALPSKNVEGKVVE